MDKTVNAINDSCECTELCKTNNLNLTYCSYRILILEDFPRIVLDLLEAERNLLVFLIESLDVNFNGIAYVYKRRSVGRGSRVATPFPRPSGEAFIPITLEIRGQ